jgi:hypothetical protein
VSDEGGKKLGAAAGAGGLGLAAILKLCSHEGAEVGVAAKALAGAERAAVSEGAVVSRGASQAAKGGRAVGISERAVARGVGVGALAADGERMGARALELLPNLVDLPLSFAEDEDDPTPAARREPNGGALLDRALQHGAPIASPSLTAAWGEHPGENVTARPVSSSAFAFFYASRRALSGRVRAFWLGPRFETDFARVTGAAATPAEAATLLADARAAQQIESASGGYAVANREALSTLIETSGAKAVLLAGWSRAGDPRLVLRDGTRVREGEIHAACLAAHAYCIVLRRSADATDPRGAFAAADPTLAMLRAAASPGANTTPATLITAMLPERTPAVTVTALVAAGDTVYAVRSEASR